MGDMPNGDSTADSANALSPAMRWTLALLSFGAGAVHLVMVPQHAQASLRTGLAFAAAGWFQIAFGAAILAAPRRLWLWLAAGANACFVALWVVSRTVGLPAWTGDGGLETAKSADLLCVGFEIAIVVVAAAALLFAPRRFERWTRSAVVVTAVVGVCVLVGTTAVLASPSTATHVHGADEGQVAGSEAHVHTHSHDSAGVASSAGHAHGESTVTYDQLPPKTKAEVDQVIALWAHRYPTAADAQRDGWFRATKNLYGIGAHYLRSSSFSGAASFDPLNPNIMLFDGEGPDAKFAGVSYIVIGTPEGFTGNDDVWHAHSSVCIQGGIITSLSEENSPVWLSESECTAAGGQVLPIGNDEMIHLWIGPDYIDSAPIFAHDHPKLLGGYDPKRDGSPTSA
jgi:hypothetical protein